MKPRLVKKQQIYCCKLYPQMFSPFSTKVFTKASKNAKLEGLGEATIVVVLKEGGSASA
jgi:hypothetical protein